MTTPTPRWPTALLAGLEAALNRALALDSAAQEALRPLEGRSVALSLKPWPAPVGIRAVAGRLRVENPDEVDLRIAATPGALLALAAEKGGFSLPAGRIDISGDADLARRIQKLVAQLDPDWNAPFARVFGEVAGQQIAQGLRGVLRWGRETAKAMVLNSSEYLREESRDLVAPGELDAFGDEVDRLRDDVERLQARLDRIGRLRNAQGPRPS